MNARTERTVSHEQILKVLAEALARTAEEKIPSKQQEMLQAMRIAIGDGTDASPEGLEKLMRVYAPEQKSEDTPGTQAHADKVAAQSTQPLKK